uniref:Uncharacterized protein n=1 Tax=Parascaris univalens TaxID=6257 RepID=A0A915AXD8_PARUN
MVCQRKDAVLIECAAGSDETFGTKTLGTQTSVFEEKELPAIESSTCKATQTQTSSSSSTRAVHDYDTEVSCQVAESTGIPPSDQGYLNQRLGKSLIQ